MTTPHPPEKANGEREAPIDIEALVNRFLSWHLPNDFHPDGGVSLDPKYRGQVVGTNLLTATQAHAMVEHMLGMAKIGQPGEYGAGYQISTGAVGLRLARAALSQSPVAEGARALWVHDLDGPTETIHSQRENFGEDHEWTEFRSLNTAHPAQSPAVGEPSCPFCQSTDIGVWHMCPQKFAHFAAAQPPAAGAEPLATYRTFWEKHALGPMLTPSCLVCGQKPEKVAIKHAELSSVVVCEKCRDAAAGAEQDAAQYRWLLSREHASIAFIWLLAPYRHVLDAPSLNSPEEIDTAVAMAMAKEQKP